MSDGNYYMYSQNRYMMGAGNNPFQNRTQYAFELATSAHYRQFHQMKSEMPSDVLELFKANEIGFLKAPVKKKCRDLDPVSSLGMNLAEMFAIPNLELMEEEKHETKLERKERIRREKVEKNEVNIQNKMKEWNPFEKTNMTEDPEKTLFVSRMSYRTTEKELKYQFEKYGLIKNVYIARDQQGKSRGYGFVEFQNKDDFINAYKNANHKKINGRKIVADFQRGRTILKWRPMRFGGGLGEQRMTKEEHRKHEEQVQRKVKANGQRASKSRERSRNKKEKKSTEDPRRRQRKGERKEKKERRDKREY